MNQCAMANSINYYIKFYVEVSLDRSVITIMCRSCVNVFSELLEVDTILCREVSQCAGQLSKGVLQETWTCKGRN